MAGIVPGLTRPFNAISSTMKGIGAGMANDARVARSMASGASSAFKTAGGGFGGARAAGTDLMKRGSMAWRNASMADKARYAGYAGAAGLTAWGLSRDN